MLIFKLNTGSIVTQTGRFKGLSPINAIKEWLTKIVNEGGSSKALLFICLFVFVAIVLKNLFLYMASYFQTPLRNRLINDLRSKMYHNILRLPIGFFSEQKKGEVMSKMSNDLNEVESSAISVLESIMREPINVILYLVYLIVLSPQLTLFLVIFIPIAGFILGRIGRALKKQNLKVMEQYGYIFSTVEETLGGMRVIKGFNAEKQMSNKFELQNADMLHLKNKATRRRDLASPLSEALGVTAVLVVLYYGGRMVLSHSFSLSAEDFITYIAIFSQLISPLKVLSSAAYNVQKGAASIDRIEALINEPITIQEIEKPTELKSFENSIELKNVSFAYNDATVLNNINLTIKKGQTIALVGSSGAGKSTLADLIPRFIDATDGEVLIDGINIKNYTLKSIRNQMGIVTQEAILFNDTIANNISLGIENPEAAKVEQAAKIANAYNYISQKEAAFETNIGDRGNKLSGGERQRLTIARAVMKNPPILILDEATSALDTESERLVQDAINHLMENRTSIVIAHRLSTVRHADEIIVLQKGEIVERGSHEGLIAQNGFYKRLVDMQEVK